MSVETNDEGDPLDPEVSKVADIIYRAIGDNWEIDFQDGYYDAAAALLESDWLRDHIAAAGYEYRVRNEDQNYSTYEVETLGEAGEMVEEEGDKVQRRPKVHEWVDIDPS